MIFRTLYSEGLVTYPANFRWVKTLKLHRVEGRGVEERHLSSLGLRVGLKGLGILFGVKGWQLRGWDIGVWGLGSGVKIWVSGVVC